MNFRKLGKTNFNISEISLGTWQVGGKWGSKFDHSNAEKILNQAIDSGINFIDTADVYGEGESEKAVGKIVKSRKEKIYVASKCGRRISPFENKNFTVETLRQHVEDSLKNTGLETIDLIQLHCPPNEVYYRPEIFELFDKLKQEGKIQNLGVSIEKIEQGLKAIEYPNVTSLQIIFNMFRLRPSQLLFKEAAKKDVGIIVRVPLASGLLSGKFKKDTQFERGDHRFFNRKGLMFDKGETFSGVPYDVGLNTVEQIKKLFNNPDNLAPFALKWILQFNEVSCIIPGASNEEQVNSNISATKLPEFTKEQNEQILSIYNTYIKQFVHQLW